MTSVPHRTITEAQLAAILRDWIDTNPLVTPEQMAKRLLWTLPDTGLELTTAVVNPLDVEGDSGECWFCGDSTTLIAGHDEWDEARLACLPCDERLRAIASHRLLIVHRDRESWKAAAPADALLRALVEAFDAEPYDAAVGATTMRAARDYLEGQK